jgi:hypothetical protein
MVRDRIGWIVAAAAAGLLAGCGNFSLSDILDAPPPGGLPIEPRVLTLVPVTVNVPVSTATVSTVVKFTAQGGILPYVWAEDTNGTDGSIDSTGLYTVPEAPGTYTVSVTDDAGAFSESTVMASLTVPLSISPAAITIGAGSSVTFTASGGLGSYGWSLTQGGGSFTPGLASATYTAPGFAESAKITLTDTTTSDTRDAFVTVTAAPTVLTISPTTISLGTGQTVAFSAGGGVVPYAYSVLDGGVGGSIDAAGLYTAPASAGTDTVRVTDWTTLTSDATVTVYFPLTIVPTGVAVQPGETYTFSASGGVPPYSYYVAPGEGLIDVNGLYTAPGSPGSATVEVSDSIGNASTAAVTIQASVTWSIVSIDTVAKSGQYASLALDPTGPDYHPRIAYYESQQKELRLAAWNGTAWSVATVDASDRAGQYASLALDPTGPDHHPRIAYYNAAPSKKNLMYAAWDGATWSIQTVDSGGDVGQYASLALTAGGNPRIAYYDATGNQLKYVENNGAGWETPIIVDAAADVGKFASLALDASGHPRIAYYDATGNQLKYVENNGAGWEAPVIVDTAGDVGQYASLALDASGRPRIAYYDTTGNQLKYVENNGAGWEAPIIVDTAGDVGQFASLALEPGTGLPRIAYYDTTNRNLKYAAWNGASWDVEAVDEAGDVGKYASLRLEASGKPRIAYYNATAQDLKLAQSP